MTNLQVTIQAFLQQIQSWSITLSRQQKKLKSLKPSVKNKFKLNSIQIILTQIESAQLKYKKVKNKYHQFLQTQNRIPNLERQNEKNLNDQVLYEYSQFSKGFLDILEKISLIEQQKNDGNQNIESKEENNVKNRPKSQSVYKPEQKSFLNQTFAYKIAKQPSKSKANKSIFEKRKSYKDNQQSSTYRSKGHSLYNNPQISNKSVSNNRSINKPLTGTNLSVNEDEDRSLWEIRHQLAQITQMMKQMKNQIKFHEHQDTTKEISALESKNRKIASQLKSVREENRFIMQKIQEIKNELNEQKKAQVDMINRFQKRSLINSSAKMYDSRAIHGDQFRSLNQTDKSPITNRKGDLNNQNVPDWVKMRI